MDSTKKENELSKVENVKIKERVKETIRAKPFQSLLTVAVIGLVTGLFIDARSLKKNWPQQKTPAFEQVGQISNETPIVELVEQLETESRMGIEYFNSPAYDNLVSRLKVISDSTTADSLRTVIADSLRDLIKEPNRTYFLTSLALREISLIIYKQLDPVLRAAVLVDGLNQSKYFNGWGLPHLYSSKPQQRPDPVQAIIELHRVALPGLKKLLFEKRRAPLWGSEEKRIFERYKYRVADYAFAMILKIEGIDLILPEAPVSRDRLITQYLNGQLLPGQMSNK